MSKYLEEFNSYNSTLTLVFPITENTIGLKCKLKAIKKKNYKLYDSDIIWYNLNDERILNSIIGGSKGIKIHYFWLGDGKINNSIDTMTLNYMNLAKSSAEDRSVEFSEMLVRYNQKFKTEYKAHEVVILMLYLTNKFVWDDQKLISFLEELERDYFSIKDVKPPCSNCRYRFLKNLTRKCDYLYVEANIPM